MVLTLLQNAFPKAILRLERLLGRRLEHIMPNIRGREGPLGPNVFHLLPDIEVSARFVIFCTLTWTDREPGVGRFGRWLLLG